MFCNRAIGVFDSGIGGVSVLRELQRLMPNEDYIYLADEEHAPYGEKSAEEVLQYSTVNVKRLIDLGCKAIVIACNTATAVSADHLRETFSVPIFGIEPAVKPAVKNGGNILVLTTERTAAEERFKRLVTRYRSEEKARIYVAPAQKLVTFVERGECDSDEAAAYLADVFKEYSEVRFTSCVLGCTHFSFAKNAVTNALGYVPEFYDGSCGTAEHTRRFLEKNGLASSSENKGEVIYLVKNNNNRHILNNK
ncbi:MAG: glutamate racemase [Clostridia bacterium]|nr:glutamate racemase [Clostridia bacterium]